jgi:hypothetical protein
MTNIAIDRFDCTSISINNEAAQADIDGAISGSCLLRPID